MKILFTSILIFILQNITILCLDNCGNPQHCPANKKYPYIACNGNTICSSDPLNEFLPSVRKAPYPICVKLSSDHTKQGPLSILMPDINNETGIQYTEVYSLSELTDPNIGDLDCAENSWKCVCGTQNWECECEIDVYFSSRNSDWEYPDRTLAYATQSYQAYLPEKDYCDDLLCNGSIRPSHIRFNNTADFKKVRNGKVTRFFYNNSNWDNVQNVLYANKPNEFQVFNFCDVLAHEIGHMYGLVHLDKNCLSENSFGVMNSITPENVPKAGLSNDDKCAFMKLYCNTLVSVNENIINSNEFKTFPNPVTTIINISLSINNPTEDVKITLFDINGKYIGLFYNHKLTEGQHTIPINIVNLNAGVYIYNLNIGNESTIEKFIISH